MSVQCAWYVNPKKLLYSQPMFELVRHQHKEGDAYYKNIFAKFTQPVPGVPGGPGRHGDQRPCRLATAGYSSPKTS